MAGGKVHIMKRLRTVGLPRVDRRPEDIPDSQLKSAALALGAPLLPVPCERFCIFADDNRSREALVRFG